MRIAFVSTILGYPFGGADTMWTHAAEAARARGDPLLVSVSPAVAAHPRIAALGATVHLRTPDTAPRTFAARLARKLRRITRSDPLLTALGAFGPDLVIISQGGTYDLILHPAWLDWFARSGTRYRIVANWQQESPVLSVPELALARRALCGAEHVFFVSSRNMDVTRRHLAEPLPHARVLQNPLRWRPADVTPWPPAPPLRLAAVSRLDEGKGLHLLLPALATIPRGTDWHLSIFGQGPAEASLRATVSELGLTGRVDFRGYVQDLRTIWADSHLLVSASIEDGVPMTIPEAMLCQRPVLATAVGGATDWLRDGETGFLCPAPTLPYLTAALQTALTASARWPEMGKAAASQALARYRPDDYLSLLA